MVAQSSNTVRVPLWLCWQDIYEAKAVSCKSLSLYIYIIKHNKTQQSTKSELHLPDILCNSYHLNGLVNFTHSSADIYKIFIKIITFFCFVPHQSAMSILMSYQHTFQTNSKGNFKAVHCCRFVMRNPPVTGRFHSQRFSYMESISIS